MYVRIALAILLGLFTCTVASAGIYYWVDDQGVRNYTTEFDRIPEAYRPGAQALPLPEVPERPAELTPDTAQKEPTKIPYAPGSPFLVSARINGLGPITLILDTGADRTMVAPSALQRLGISTENAVPGMIRGVTGTSHAGGIWVNSVEVGTAKAGPFLIIVHESDLKGADGLLGRDFLAGFNVTMDPKGQVVTLSPH
jgi:predicted aspartyl protease